MADTALKRGAWNFHHACRRGASGNPTAEINAADLEDSRGYKTRGFGIFDFSRARGFCPPDKSGESRQPKRVVRLSADYFEEEVDVQNE
jgi:hypothetical protein